MAPKVLRQLKFDCITFVYFWLSSQNNTYLSNSAAHVFITVELDPIVELIGHSLPICLQLSQVLQSQTKCHSFSH